MNYDPVVDSLIFILIHYKFIFFASVAHFLESRGMVEESLEIATDPNYRFDLSLQLCKLDIAKV